MESFENFKLDKEMIPNFYRKNASLAPISDKEMILFGGFRFNDDTKDGLLLFNTETKDLTEIKDPKSDLFFYYEALWVPIHKRRFCMAKAFDYEVDTTEFAIFNLEDNEVQVKLFPLPKEEAAEDDAPAEAAPAPQ